MTSLRSIFQYRWRNVNARVIQRYAINIINVSLSDGKQAIDAGCAMGRHEKLL